MSEPIETTVDEGSVEPVNDERKPRRRFLILLIPLCLIGLSVFLWSQYLTTRQPLSRILPATGPISGIIKPHYLFSIYGVREPWSVAVTWGGERIYATESEGERMVRAFDGAGKPLFGFAPPKSAIGTRAPAYVAVDASGKIFVSDRLRKSVDTYDAGGNFLSSLTPWTDDGWMPLGLRFVGGDLLVTEVTATRHRVVRGNGLAMAQSLGKEGKEPGEFSFPNSVIADADGRTYVSDSNNGRVQVFDKQNRLINVISGFGLPRGLALDDMQRLYVVDAVGQEVKVYDVRQPKAEPLFSFGDFGVDEGLFNFPNDIAIDGNGRIYIADRSNNRVQVWLY